MAGMLVRVLAEADGCGVPRKAVARRMKVSLETVESWVLPGRGQVAPSVRLVQLLVDADILPGPARKRMAEELAGLAEMTAVDALDLAGVDDGGADQGPALRQVCEVQERLGRLAGKYFPSTPD